MVPFAAWCALCLRLQHEVLIIENSDRFKVEVVESIFGAQYACMCVRLCGTSFGWPGRRPRLWCVCVHLRLVTRIYAGFSNIIPLLFRTCNVDYHEFLVGHTADELKAELDVRFATLAGRKVSAATLRGMSVTEAAEIAKLDRSWEIVLSAAEAKSLSNCERLIGIEGATYMMNQYAANDRAVHCTGSVRLFNPPQPEHALLRQGWHEGPFARI